MTIHNCKKNSGLSLPIQKAIHSNMDKKLGQRTTKLPTDYFVVN